MQGKQPMFAMAVKHRACCGSCGEAVRTQVDIQGWYHCAFEEGTVSALLLISHKVSWPGIEHV